MMVKFQSERFSSLLIFNSNITENGAFTPEWRSLCVMHHHLCWALDSALQTLEGGVPTQCWCMCSSCSPDTNTIYAKACGALYNHFTLLVLQSALFCGGGGASGSIAPLFSVQSSCVYGPKDSLWFPLSLSPDIQTDTKAQTAYTHKHIKSFSLPFSTALAAAYSVCMRATNFALQSIYKPSPRTGSQLHVHTAVTFM